jgi:uncharacterized damage-inducible protein DinB
MRSVIPALLLAAGVHGQTFDPKLPDTVPAVTGTVKEQAVLRYVDIREGSGAPGKAGQQFAVRYTGWLRDGTKFDSSEGKDPLKFVQGRREVIPGFDAGFEGMKVGGKRRIFIPWQLAYGEQGRGKIPPKAELIFDVELMDATDAPPLSASADLLLSFNGSEAHVLELAKAVPEETYAWRPGPGVRSFQETFLHIAYGNRLLLSIANDQPSQEALFKLVKENQAGEAQKMTKQAVIQMLQESFATVRKTFEAERAASLGRTIEFWGQPATRRGVLTVLDAHVAEHLGQLIAYARVNGITPPWSK